MTSSPELCKDCGGNCCRHPNMTTAEYERLVMAIGREKAEAAGPQKLGNWWMFRDTCPGKLDAGCVLPYGDRPLACKIYPFVAIPSINGSIAGHELLLDLRHCPRWKEFGERYEETKEEFLRGKCHENEIVPKPSKCRWKKYFT
jgi:Uncharacterised protein family (UPF0153).